jgi:tight adherence protein B
VRALKPLVLATAAAALLALPATASAGVTLRGVDATKYPTLHATVVSSAGAGAQPVLRENGRPVSGLSAQNLACSKAVVLGIDRSRSMRGTPLGQAKQAARSFLGAKCAGDAVSVVAFGHGAYALSRPSSSPIDADSALANLSVDAQQGTSLYDGIVLAVQQLKDENLASRVLVLLTDGADTGSRATLEQAVAAARKAEVSIYAIGIEGDTFTPDALQRLASQTGGQYYGASSASGLLAVYASIAATLRHTWKLEYFTSASPGDQIQLEASIVGAGSSSVAYTISKDAADVGSPSAPSGLIPSGAYSAGGALAIGLAVAGLVLLAAFLFLAAQRGSWVRTRIAAHVGETKATSKEQRREQRMATLSAVFRATEKSLGHLRQWRWVQRMLERANLPLKTVEFFWLMIGGAFGLSLLCALAGQTPLVILAAMCIGGGLPFLYVLMKMRKRIKAFEDQLPDVLITIAASLKAGHSFKQGLQAVVDEGQPPASEEFKRVLTETALGRPMDEALEAMAERCGSKNFEFAITAVTIQRQVGGSLATLFDMVADTVRQRQQFARKIKSLTAMGRMSAYVLVGIPFFLAGAISLLNPTYMAPLFHTSTGHLLIFSMLGMMAVGSAFLKKIVSFKG